jgi:hypothetical protein
MERGHMQRLKDTAELLPNILFYIKLASLKLTKPEL